MTVDEELSNPWERWGWVIQSVWLVFLVFPVLSVLDSDDSWWVRSLAIALLAVFGAVYAVGGRHLDRLDRQCSPGYRTRMYRVGGTYLAALVVITLMTIPIIWVDALSVVPFLVAFGMVALPLSWALGWGLGCFALTVTITATRDNAEDAWVLAAIVFAVGAMMAGVRLVSERSHGYQSMSRELALVAERERVARDVHDVLGHSLTVVTVKAELAERLVDLDPQRAKAELAEIQSLSRQALAEIRATVGGLRVARLGDELAAARTALGGAGIEAHVPDDPSAVDPRHRIVLAWALREAVTNVVRHSDADVCRVELATSTLRVVDDGRGLEDRPEGNGIRGLRERVTAAGGTLTIATGPQGHGTTLEVTL